LKAKRATIDPRARKLAVTARRRARGHLREEVAQIAGISVTWYTWLEQGRFTNPSPAVLEALAGALQLSAAERKHLYRLARPDLDPRVRSALTARLSPPMSSLLDGLSPHPAYAVNGAWDVLAENDAARALFGSFFGSREHEPNVLARLVLDPAWQALFVDHPRIVETAVAQFRATTADRSRDAAVQALVTSLSARSPLFAGLWRRGQVDELPAWRKTLRIGKRALHFDYATFHPDSEPDDVRITVYTPADELARAAALRLLRRS
jgi:transcriptional regulator with XRE-family HTH domain